MGTQPSKFQTGSIFDGSKFSHEILHHLLTIALQNSNSTNTQNARKQLAQIFCNPLHLHPEKLSRIQWNQCGTSNHNPSLAILLLMLANREFDWAKQCLEAIVEHEIDLDWNQTTVDDSHIAKTTPLLYLTMMADTDNPWAEDLLIEVIEQDIQKAIQSDIKRDRSITVH